MSITYSTNWMGPINNDWIAEHGTGWSAGRIDVYGTGSHYPEEIAVPPMKSEDWNRFSDWLDDFSSETMLDLDQLLEEFHKSEPQIEFLKIEKEPHYNRLVPNITIEYKLMYNLIHMIANDYVELSDDKVRWQRDDYIRRAREVLNIIK